MLRHASEEYKRRGQHQRAQTTHRPMNTLSADTTALHHDDENQVMLTDFRVESCTTQRPTDEPSKGEKRSTCPNPLLGKGPNVRQLLKRHLLTNQVSMKSRACRYCEDTFSTGSARANHENSQEFSGLCLIPARVPAPWVPPLDKDPASQDLPNPNPKAAEGTIATSSNLVVILLFPFCIILFIH